jgi:hypothetical protein
MDIALNEEQAVGIYHDIHGRFKNPAIWSIFSGDQESIASESITNNDYRKIETDTRSMHSLAKPLVYVEDRSIKVDSKRLEIGKQYTVIIDSEKYVIVKAQEGVIDLYECPR